MVPLGDQKDGRIQMLTDVRWVGFHPLTKQHTASNINLGQIFDTMNKRLHLDFSSNIGLGWK